MGMFIGFVAVLWAFACLIWSTQAHGLASLVALAVGIGPGALLGYFAISGAKGRASLKDSALALAGIVPGPGFFQHEEDGAGIALNPSARKLALWGAGVAKCYDYGEVRSWEFIHEKGEWVVGQAVATLRNKGEAAANSGFYVQVRDVDDPRWRVPMSDPATQQRWMELLRQEINEGGAGAAHAGGAGALAV